MNNLIDYMLVVFYDGSFDSPMSTFLTNASNNWFGIRDRLGARGFVYFVHDHEHGLDTNVQSYNRVGPWGGAGNNNWAQGQYNTRDSSSAPFFNASKSNPQYLHEFLAYSAEYRQRFADRVQKHFFNNGALTTTAAVNRFNAIAAQVDTFVHAEAARWGSATLNRNSQVSAKTKAINFFNTGGTVQSGQTVFPAQPRSSLVIEQLRGYQDPVGTSKALFPAASLLAPTYSGTFGGPVANPYTFNITNPNTTGVLYYTVNGVDPRPIGGGAPVPEALTGTSPRPITLTGTSTVRARVYVAATQLWSALTEADYLVGALATPANLVISKIHYNPASADDLTEFLEIMNISSVNVDLTNVRVLLGVQFSFPIAFLLPPGGRALVVRDVAAFTAAYGSGLSAQIAGVFANSTNLDNSGERLQLVDALGAVIRDFSYNDQPPWPTSPDGEGPCLVLIRPETNPDHSIGTNWRASATLGGSPGHFRCPRVCSVGGGKRGH